MGIKQKTVFISYRRTNFYTALAVYQDLTANGYDVFFDYESIDSGDFEQVIFENIQYRAHFVVILSPSALERLGEKNSIMRREVEMAIDEKRNIIPLMMETFDFGSQSAKEALTGKLEVLSRYNGLTLVKEYFRAGMEKLRRFLNIELEGVRLPALSAAVVEDTKRRLVKVKEEPVVQEESLTAEEWFERGYKSQKNENHKEAILYYQKAVQINPKDAISFSNLGSAFLSIGNHDEALEAYEKAIQINPKFREPYLGKGLVLEEKLTYFVEAEKRIRNVSHANPDAYSIVLSELKRFKELVADYRKFNTPDFAGAFNHVGNILSGATKQRYEDAEYAYREAIQINPKDATAYLSLGNLLLNMNRYEESEAIYRKAIQFNPEDATAYSNLGNLLNMQERLPEAENAFKKAIEIDPENGIARMSLWGLLKRLGKKEQAKKHEQLARELIEKENEYNRACFESLCGNADEAFALLKIAVEERPLMKNWSKQDPNLKKLRTDPRFWEIVGEEEA